MILALRILYFEDLSVGMTETLSKTIAASDVVGFAQLTGDRNPIHLSEHFAAKTQFGKRIAHGLYTASLISAVLGTRLPGPGAVYISQTLNFRAPDPCIRRCEIWRSAHHRHFQTMFHELHFYALKILRFKALKKSGVHFDAVNTKSASQLDPIKQRHGLGDAQLIHVTFGKRAQLRHNVH